MPQLAAHGVDMIVSHAEYAGMVLFAGLAIGIGVWRLRRKYKWFYDKNL